MLKLLVEALMGLADADFSKSGFDADFFMLVDIFSAFTLESERENQAQTHIKHFILKRDEKVMSLLVGFDLRCSLMVAAAAVVVDGFLLSLMTGGTTEEEVGCFLLAAVVGVDVLTVSLDMRLLASDEAIVFVSDAFDD